MAEETAPAIELEVKDAVIPAVQTVVSGAGIIHG